MSDFFTSDFGDFRRPTWPASLWTPLADAAADTAMTLCGSTARVHDRALSEAARSILVVGVLVPGRTDDMDAVVAKLAQTRHRVTVSVTPMGPLGKFENIDRAVREAPQALNTYDWLIIVDDDVGLPKNFLDDFVHLAERCDLRIAQPAHRFKSYMSWPLTRRRWGSLVRQTGFVEIGPLTALHRSTFDQLVPFPQTRWCWGVDVYWAELARRNGWRMGVVDGTPVEHRRPVAESYARTAAIAEGKEFLSKHNVTLSRREIFGPNDVLASW